MDIALELFGWLGSFLVVWSLMQARLLRFRWMNLAGAFVAGTYNAIIGIWPFVAMNAAIVIIDVYWLMRLYRERHDPAIYQVLPVAGDDPYVQHVLAVHAGDLEVHAPGFEASPTDAPERSTFLVVRGDEPVGFVVVRPEGDGVGLVELDWVKPSFRDFTPGEFVYRQSGALTAAGFRRLEVAPHNNTDREYLRAMGFHTDHERWVRDIAA